MSHPLQSIGPEVARLERALLNLEPLLTNSGLHRYVQTRLKTICTDLFRAVGSATNTTRLEAGARAAVAFDFASLRALLERLVSLGDDNLEPDLVPAAADCRKDLATAIRLVENTEAQLHRIEPLEIGLRFELFIDRALTRYLNLLKRPSAELDRLVQIVKEWLAQASEKERQTIWAKTTREVQLPNDDDRWASSLPLDESVVGRGFFDGASAGNLDYLIARYLVEFRPRLVGVAFKAGVESVPMPPASVARILAWKADAEVLTPTELRLVAHIMLLAHLVVSRMHGEAAELAAALGVPEDSRLLKGQSEDQAKDLVTGEGFHQAFLCECRGVLAALAGMASGAPEPELGLLTRYKLALEVGLPRSREPFEGENEVDLQRALAAFMIQHGLYATGTRFGSAETDLVAGHQLNPLVIEVKLFKDKPSAAKILKAFVQLRGYMDQSPYKSRGALVLFNLSDVPIHSSGELIGGRVAVIPVNLPLKTPSKREQYFEIAGGRPDQPLDVLLVGLPDRPRVAKKRHSLQPSKPSSRKAKG